MKSKRSRVVVATLLILGLAVGATWSVVSAGFNDANRLRLEGTWRGTVDISGDEGLLTVLITAIPLDPTNRRVSLQLQNVREDPNFGGLVKYLTGLEVTHETDWWGEAVRTGPRTFDFTLMRHNTDVNAYVPNPVPPGGTFKQVYVAVSSGTMELTSPTTMVRTLTVGYFHPSQNPFEEAPLYDCGGPYTSTLERIPVVPPCTVAAPAE
jgi:hypothetical protein